MSTKECKKTTKSRASLQNGLASQQEALQRGIGFQQVGQLNEAIHWYKKALKASPDNTTALNNLGVIHAGQGRLEEAKTAFSNVIFSEPNNTQALINLGKVNMDLGDLDAAVIYYNKVTTLVPNNALALRNLGIILTKQGRLDAAVTNFQKILAIDPDESIAYYNLGNIFTKQNKWNEAISSFQKAISIKPDFAEVHLNLGNALKGQGKLKEAVTSFQKAISIKPNYAEAYSNLGVSLNEQGKLEETVNIFQKAISIKPDFVKAYSNLGLVLESACYDALTRNDTIVDRMFDKIATLLEQSNTKIQHQSVEENNIQKQSPTFDCLEFYLIKHRINKLIGRKTEKDHKNIVKNLPKAFKETTVNDQNTSGSTIIKSKTNSSKKMVAFLTLGRSGSGLFHSMLDGHPEISIMPAVYMSGYFSRGVWQNIVSSGFHKAAEQFTDLYRVLFDSRSLQKPPPPFISDTYGVGSGVGVNEGFVKLGENRDTPLSLDRSKFISNLKRVLKQSLNTE